MITAARVGGAILNAEVMRLSKAGSMMKLTDARGTRVSLEIHADTD